MLVSALFLLVICTWSANAAVVHQGEKDDQFFRRDYTFDRTLGGWLKFYPMPAKWKEAAFRCHQEGAILASPLNENISEALISVMKDHGLTTVPMFTGISNTYADSEYQSMEGVPITDLCLVWSDKPNVKVSGNICIAMYANGTVTAVACADPHPFVCYRQKGVKRLNECGAVDPGYTYYSAIGSCYKKYSTKLTWSEAFKRCAIDGAHLAVINSRAEAEILRQIKDSTPLLLIGARAWNDEREWITVQGQSLEEAGYSMWIKGEPNNVNENCVAIGFYGANFDNGVMNDVSCNAREQFVCEIKSEAN